MRPDPGVLGVFADPGRAAAALRALRERGASDLRAAMPAPFPVLVSALGRTRSSLGKATLGAALAGVIVGFAICVGTSVAWPLITGGKAIVSVPPFVIVAFELAVLLGGLANLIALAVLTAVGRNRRSVPGDLRFSGDHIGIFVGGGDAGAETVLREHGAKEVRRVA